MPSGVYIRKVKSAVERFWAKVQITPGCWLWTGYGLEHGHGLLQIGSSRASHKLMLTHRFSFQLHGGVLDDSLEIDHICRNPRCVNPDHLRQVTHRENMLNGAWSLTTHCPRGHEYSEENTDWYKGARRCKSCKQKRKEIKNAT